MDGGWQTVQPSDGWQTVQPSDGWQTVSKSAPPDWETVKPKVAATPTAEPKGFLSEAWETIKGAGKAAIDKPGEIIPGAAEALTTGVLSVGRAGDEGLTGLAEGAKEKLQGGEFGKGFEKGAASADEALDKGGWQTLVAPQTEFGKKATDVLGLIPRGIHAAGETVFDKTGSPALAAGTEGLGNLVLLRGVTKEGKPGEMPPPKSAEAPPLRPETRGQQPMPPQPPETVAARPSEPMGAPPPKGDELPPELRGTKDMNLGIPAKPEDLPWAMTRPEERPTGSIGDAVRKVLAPASRGASAKATEGIFRANLGEEAHESERAYRQLYNYAKSWDSRPIPEAYEFIDRMEKGQKQINPADDEVAKALRTTVDTARDEVRALGKGQLENFIENYFPHIWKDKAAAGTFFARKPLAGSATFLKKRTLDSFKEGLDAGLEPVTTNPVEMMMIKHREMLRYIYGQKIFNEMKGSGLTKFVKFGDKPPEGYTKLNDKIARSLQFSDTEKGMILRGEYYAPDGAATIFNNHLSPGLTGNTAFDMWRNSANMMNGAQLGFSLFHLGFTTIDVMTSKLALGIKQMSRGDIAKGAGTAAQALNPAQPIINLIKGDRLLKQYIGAVNDPNMAPIVEALTQAGGRVALDPFYRNTQPGALRQALKQAKYGEAAKAVLPTIMDVIMAPIFQYLVPRQKLGVFMDLANDAREKNPNMSVAEKRETMGRLWNSVDNRMGQLVYDNLFWNRTLKDVLMATTRSVGWNLGTFRELGGGIADIADIKKQGMSDRTAYVLALPMMAGILGAITQYLYTGQPPQEMKDLYYPKTGKMRPDGSEDRVSLPTYMKDVYAYSKDAHDFVKYGSNPFQTLQNKMHPLLSLVSETLSNEDFYGGAIRNPGDPWVQQMQDEGNHILQTFEPFSYRNFMQQQQEKGKGFDMGDYLSSPSMIGVTPAPGYITKSPEQVESGQVNRLHEPLYKKFSMLLKEPGADQAAIVSRMRTSGFTPHEIASMIKYSHRTGPGRLKKFGDNAPPPPQ